MDINAVDNGQLGSRSDTLTIQDTTKISSALVALSNFDNSSDTVEMLMELANRSKSLPKETDKPVEAPDLGKRAINLMHAESEALKGIPDANVAQIKNIFDAIEKFFMEKGTTNAQADSISQYIKSFTSDLKDLKGNAQGAAALTDSFQHSIDRLTGVFRAANANLPTAIVPTNSPATDALVNLINRASAQKSELSGDQLFAIHKALDAILGISPCSAQGSGNMSANDSAGGGGYPGVTITIGGMPANGGGQSNHGRLGVDPSLSYKTINQRWDETFAQLMYGDTNDKGFNSKVLNYFDKLQGSHYYSDLGKATANGGKSPYDR